MAAEAGAKLCMICRSTWLAAAFPTCPYSKDHIATLTELVRIGLVRK